jgi:hypothetical protein
MLRIRLQYGAENGRYSCQLCNALKSGDNLQAVDSDGICKEIFDGARTVDAMLMHDGECAFTWWM